MRIEKTIGFDKVEHMETYDEDKEHEHELEEEQMQYIQ